MTELAEHVSTPSEDGEPSHREPGEPQNRTKAGRVGLSDRRDGGMARLLKQGMEGDDVANLQALLNYHLREQMTEALPVITTFGPRTHDAVRAFQRLNGLDDDGKVGELTSAQLLTVCEFNAQYTLERQPEFEIGDSDERGESTTFEAEYELKDGVQVSLDPWKAPPGPTQYKLEFEAAWIVKNPGALPVSLGLSVGAEIGRTPFLPSLDIPYVTSGAGTVAARIEKDFSVGPILYDVTLQNSFEIEHEAREPEVKASAAVSVASGISVAVIRNHFYLFTQGELAAALKWHDGTLHPSLQFTATTGVKFTF